MRRIVLFLPVLLFFSCTCSKMITRQERAQYSIALDPWHELKRTKSVNADANYLKKLNEDSISMELTNAVGYYLQKMGYVVYTRSSLKPDSADFILCSSKVELRQFKNRAYDSNENGAAALSVKGIRLKLIFNLKARQHWKAKQTVLAKSEVREDYSKGDVAVHTSLMGILSGAYDDKTTYIGTIYTLKSQEAFLYMINDAAIKLAADLDERIRYYHYYKVK